ncbi:DNA invertase Pin-like site-specific DNA recombinase [Pedobacter cryoconitis]|uniref:hypothetical protein n=1 Tax=Pedobacter cryoconitis TaxID=188932 RepID=UPI00160831A0|nr:hypothetical protein [Pedobacter cryoconitis]MBB6271847.1 DNA invertase Pin-like site-specific DNA recombinase [Pedobacter cryoconitis]
MKEEKFAFGYMRMDNVHDDHEVNNKLKQIKDHCDIHKIELPMIFAENKHVSNNFTGNAWKDLEMTLAHAEGRVQSIIVSDRDNLTRDMSLYLLKEKELKDKYGVTIDVADGKSLKIDHSKGISMN